MAHGGKSVTYQHAQLGKFEFRRMTTHTGYFLQSVARHELQHQAALVAEPLGSAGPGVFAQAGMARTGFFNKWHAYR
jgi:hypothetical protein